MLEDEVAFLFELRGQRPGTALGITREVFRIGCDTENDLVIQEDGIALYQAEIVLEDRQFSIRNLSVGGAVFLNGERFDRAVLHKGDILTIGDSMFRFVARGEALTQDELWRPVGGRTAQGRPVLKGSRKLLLAAGLCLLAGAVIVWVVAGGGPRRVSLLGPETEQDLRGAPGPDFRTLEALYERALDLMTARHWDQALVVLDQVRVMAPNHRDVERLHRQGILESIAADWMNQARGFLAEGVPALARQALSRIPDGSVLHREADRMMREIDRRLAADRVDKVRRQMADGDWLAARAEVAAIIEEDPKDEEALALLRQIDRLEGTPPGKWHFVTREDRPSPDPADGFLRGGVVGRPGLPGGEPDTKPADLAPSSPPPASPPRPPTPLQRARSAYLRGDTDASLAELDRLAGEGAAGSAAGSAARVARQMQNDILSAKSWFHQAETLEKQGRTLESLEMWDRFLEKDRELAGKAQSSLFRQASARLGRVYHDRGKTAFDTGDLIAASRFWRMGARIDPSNQDLKRGVSLLAESAQKYYREGYSLHEINPRAAVERWRLVLEIAPPGDPYHQRAKSGIERVTAGP